MKNFMLVLFVIISSLFWASSLQAAPYNCRCEKIIRQHDRLEQNLIKIAYQRDQVFANNPLQEGQWLLPLPVLERLWELELRSKNINNRLIKVNIKLNKFC